MCEFVEDTPESYDDVMMSGLNSDIKKRVVLYQLFYILHTFYYTFLLLLLLILLNIVDTFTSRFTTCFYPFHVYMSIRCVFCVMKSFKGKGILQMS